MTEYVHPFEYARRKGLEAAPVDEVRVDTLVSRPIWQRAKHGKVCHAWKRVVEYGTQHLVAVCRPELKAKGGENDDSDPTCKKCLAMLAY